MAKASQIPVTDRSHKKYYFLHEVSRLAHKMNWIIQILGFATVLAAITGKIYFCLDTEIKRRKRLDAFCF